MAVVNGIYLRDLADEYAKNQANQQSAYTLSRQKLADSRADTQYDNRQNASALLASGDTAGARNLATQAGDFDYLSHLDTLDESQRKQAADEAEFIGRVTPALGQIDGTDGGKARREAIRPMLRQRGLSDAEIDGHDFSDQGLSVANAAAMSIKDRLEQRRADMAEKRADMAENKPITAADGAVLQPDGKGGYTVIYTPGTKPLQQVVTDPVTGAINVVNVPGTPGQGVSRAGALLAGGFEAIDKGFEAPTEGGYADRDGASGAPVNYGINQKYNPDVDVRKLTPDQAAQIRHDRYWAASGAEQMPTPAGQAVVYDTAVNMGPATAQRMVRETGGDVDKMLAWREQRYRSIAKNPANAAQLPGWLDRNEKLRSFVGSGQATGSPAPTGPTITSLGGSSGPVWKDDTRNGITGQTNTRTGEFKPLPGQKAQDANSLQQNLDTIDTSIAAVDTLSKHPGLSAAVGSGLDPHSWGSFNPLTGKPFAGTDAADFESQLDTFKSQQFLSQIAKMKGLGALSDAEGAKLSAAAGNLATNQSEDQFRANLKVIRDGLTRARERVAAQQGQHSHAAPPAHSSASSAPQGATYLGTSKKTGRPVYRLPDGRTVLG
jgi:hypothetical protein